MRAFICAIVIVAGLILASTVYARQLFWDNFEADQLGAEPLKWKNLGVGGGGGGEIVEDPERASNKVFSMPGRYVATRNDNGAFYVIGDESWTDYVAEWDWMPCEAYCGMNFRFVDEDEYYLIDKRGVEGIVILYRRQEAPLWTILAQGPWLWEANKWYRVRLEASSDTFVFKWKEVDDGTPFDQIDAAEAGVQGQDATYENGGISNGGLGLIDNVVVGETEGDLVLGVESAGKLPAIWADLKMRIMR
jgi:hypothetical protein